MLIRKGEKEQYQFVTCFMFSLAFQCSRRGGELEISLCPDGRVDIKGGTAIVLEGTLTA